MTDRLKAHDVIIIGGGPAGMSAALWCSELGLDAVLFEKEKELGGQLLWTHNKISNYLGVEATDGRDLRDRFVEQSAGLSYTRILNADIRSVRLNEKSLKLGNGIEYTGRVAMILATGLRRRRLNVPGEVELVGRGVLRSGVGEREKVVGKRVAIVGGGDAALENAILLSEAAERVYVVHRRTEFTARREFLTAAANNQKIEFVTNSTVQSIRGDSAVEAVTVAENGSANNASISVEAVLIRIGFEPNTELFRDQVVVDDEGYVRVDDACRTNIDGVFAVGDVANPMAPTISSAVGMGATAAKAIRHKAFKNLNILQ